jgi:hypothetical protein
VTQRTDAPGASGPRADGGAAVIPRVEVWPKSQRCGSDCFRIRATGGVARGVSAEGQMKDPATRTGSGTFTDALELGGERASISNGELCGSYPTA